MTETTTSRVSSPRSRRARLLSTVVATAIVPAAVSAGVAVAVPHPAIHRPPHREMHLRALPRHRHAPRIRPPYYHVRCAMIVISGRPTDACQSVTGLYAV